MIGESRAREVVERAVAAATADETFVSVEDRDVTHLRFSRNTPSTSGTYTDTTLTVQCSFGARTGSATVNQLDDASIAAAVKRAEELARLAPEDPEHMPVLGPQRYPAVDAYRDGVVDNGPLQLARGVARCIERALDAGVQAAGFGEAHATARAIGSSAGLFGYHRETTAAFSQTVRTADGRGSGWAQHVARSVDALDFADSAEVAIAKAMQSREPRPLDPGVYPVILEPACVANLVGLLMSGLGARAADEGRSVFSRPGGGNRLGERLFPTTITIRSAPADARVPGAPWDGDGVPHRDVDWIRDGVLANLAYDRYWASKAGVAPLPGAANTLMSGGTGTLADLIKSTERAVLITSLWYIRGVDPRTMLHTGLTRDGVFLVEDGAIAHPVTNFRWNDSPIAVLQHVDAMTAPSLVAPRASRSVTMSVPAVRATAFELSSVSDAV